MSRMLLIPIHTVTLVILIVAMSRTGEEIRRVVIVFRFYVTFSFAMTAK